MMKIRVKLPSGNIKIGLLEGLELCSFNLRFKNEVHYLHPQHSVSPTNTPSNYIEMNTQIGLLLCERVNRHTVKLEP